MATREELYAAIERELGYQQQKWPQDGKPLDLYGRMIVAHAELQEARLAYCKHTGNDEALKELLQVVAVGVGTFGNSLEWQSLSAFFFDEERTLPRWLEEMENQFTQSRGKESEGVGYHRDTFVAMGMAALLQHGIVEREELAEQSLQPPLF